MEKNDARLDGRGEGPEIAVDADIRTKADHVFGGFEKNLAVGVRGEAVAVDLVADAQARESHAPAFLQTAPAGLDGCDLDQLVLAGDGAEPATDIALAGFLFRG